MPTHPTPTRSSGFTLIELLMVISIIGILAAMAFPAVTMVRGLAQKAQSKNNLRQIVVAFQVYQQDNDNALPSARISGANSTGLRGDTVTDGFKHCLGAFEVLAATSQGNITSALFKCPKADLSPITIQPSRAGTAWQGQSMSYAFDFSAPGSNLNATRVLVGDRDPAYWDGSGINVAYGDGHSVWLKTTNPSATADTRNESGSAAVSGDAINPDAANDNVLLSTGKANVNLISKGSSTLSALR